MEAYGGWRGLLLFVCVYVCLEACGNWRGLPLFERVLKRVGVGGGCSCMCMCVKACENWRGLPLFECVSKHVGGGGGYLTLSVCQGAQSVGAAHVYNFVCGTHQMGMLLWAEPP